MTKNIAFKNDLALTYPEIFFECKINTIKHYVSWQYGAYEYPMWLHISFYCIVLPINLMTQSEHKIA